MSEPVADSHRDSNDYIAAATAAITAECREWRAEKAAWQEFRTRIRQIPKAPEPAVPMGNQGTAIHDGAGTQTMGASVNHVEQLQRRIRTAYGETVLSTVAADKMGEDPAEHMAAELGPDISNAVFVSADPPSSLLSMLDRTATNRIRTRERIVEKLYEERSNVESFGEELEGVREEVAIYESIYPDVSFDGLIVYHGRLGELRSKCAEIAERRQREFHSTIPSDYSRYEWNAYVFRDCDSTHPVLLAVAETIARIDDFRESLASDVAASRRHVEST